MRRCEEEAVMGDNLGVHRFEVDGVAYKLGVISAMGVLEGASWGMRVLGAPVASALATSDGLGRFIAKTANKEAVGEIMNLDTAKPAEFFVTVQKHVDMSALLDVLGDAVRIAGERLTTREIMNAFDWAVFRLLSVPGEQGDRLVEDATTFNLCLAPHLKKHGPLHVLKLFWAVLRAHTGPIGAGDPG